MWSLTLSLLIALRLLSPPGFMPSFDRGAVTITLCPDAEPGPKSVGDHHHRGHSSAAHQNCAYASAPSLGTAPGEAPQLEPAAAQTEPPIARPTVTAIAAWTRERPPVRGPPIPA